MAETGKSPAGGIASLVNELHVSDLEASKAFWCDLLGFGIAYERASEGFVYLEHPDGAQLMLCQRHGKWETAEMDVPFGRGILMQMRVKSLAKINHRLTQAGHPLYSELKTVWRRMGDREGGRQEIAVLDPDGYLMMIAEDIGERPARD